jgi:hypothetical protein
VNAKTKLATKILVWLWLFGFNPNGTPGYQSTPKFWHGKGRPQSKCTLNMSSQSPAEALSMQAFCSFVYITWRWYGTWFQFHHVDTEKIHSWS